ncbi:30S ribosomal protein S17, chloroplastic [Iris pallida]|uniref:Small ribosomal subunit protein uS17c n=1 Tax=Iris pallida TaxID=29817 RepID=A0AAX6ETJ9_IRIPA|nr:30S ribosomal protein S17, chloroplastic [Iris pallida]
MLLPSPFLLKPHPSPFLSSPIVVFPSIKVPKTPLPPPPPSLTVHAMKKLQGRVVKDQNDKTVAVEVVRLAPHPKYKRRVRIKKRYQAHDPDNQFKVGDLVQLEKSRPISKTKTFLALPVAARASRSASAPTPAVADQGLPPLQSQQDDTAAAVPAAAAAE